MTRAACTCNYTHRRKGLVLLLAILLVVGMALVFLIGMAPAGNPISALDKVPTELKFSLVNHDGQPVSEDDFLGKRLVIFFGFTHCPDVCPTTLVTLGKAVDLAQDPDIKTQILFVSVDPKRDTPQVLKQYLSHFPGQAVGLTGQIDQVNDFARAFRVHYKSGVSNAKGDYSMTHSDLVYLVSETGSYITHLKAGSDVVWLASNIGQEMSEFHKNKENNLIYQ